MLVRAKARMAEQRTDRFRHAARQQMLELASVGFALFQRHA
jgi:hypothetical protein